MVTSKTPEGRPRTPRIPRPPWSQLGLPPHGYRLHRSMPRRPTYNEMLEEATRMLGIAPKKEIKKKTVTTV